MSIKIENHSTVTLLFDLLDEDGQVIDSNRTEQPLVTEIGTHDILPSLEIALAGSKAGEQKRITLPPKAAFGAIKQTAFKTVDLNTLPEDARTEGAILGFDTPEGTHHQVRVHDIQGDQVTLDFNHPLAGKTVTFVIDVLDVQPPKE